MLFLLLDMVNIMMCVLILVLCNVCRVFRLFMFFMFRFSRIMFGFSLVVRCRVFLLLLVLLIMLRLFFSLSNWVMFLCIIGWLFISSR